MANIKKLSLNLYFILTSVSLYNHHCILLQIKYQFDFSKGSMPRFIPGRGIARMGAIHFHPWHYVQQLPPFSFAVPKISSTISHECQCFPVVSSRHKICCFCQGTGYSNMQRADEAAIYQPRKLQESPLWQLLNKHSYHFVSEYEDHFPKACGFLRQLVSDVIQNFLQCGDPKQGFARNGRNSAGNSEKIVLLFLNQVSHFH